MEHETLTGQGVISRQRGSVRHQPIIAGRDILNLVVTIALHDNGAALSSVIEHQVDIGNSFAVGLALIEKTQVIEDVSHQAGKINHAKIDDRNPLPYQVHFHVIPGGHAYRSGKLDKADRDAMLPAANVAKLEPSLFIVLHAITVVQSHPNPPLTHP